MPKGIYVRTEEHNRKISESNRGRFVGAKSVRHKHGATGTKLYYVWQQMLQRCFNETSHSYKNYGKRGITVCDEWHEFLPFKEWSLANGYQEGLTIDRIDNDGGYAVANCQWIPLAINSAKRNYGKQVNQYDVDGSFVATYSSQTEASRVTGIDSTNISGVCKGNRKTAGGFTWQFA